jgi:hypothetical protein
MSWILNQIRERIAESQTHFDELLNDGKTYRVYHEVNQITSDIGSNYGVQIFLNFPNAKSIYDLKSFGSRGISMIVDSSRKKFPNFSEEEVHGELLKRMPNARVVPIGFGHEGFHVDLESGRLTVLPSGVHVWCEVDHMSGEFLDWLFVEVYGITKTHPD